jgi:hypothetical protein
MNVRIPYPNLLMVFAGVICLLLKRWFAKYFGDLAFSYVGNLSASFAVYFLLSIAPIPKLTRVRIAALALLVVESFELTNGFGIMTNVYDPFDYLANAIGIGLAICVDAGLSRVLRVKANDETVHNAA